MNVDKRALRQLLRERRRALAASVVEEAGAAVHAQLSAWPVYQAAGAVIAYVAHENEVPATLVFAASNRRSRQIYLPSQTRNALVRWSPDMLLVARRGGVLEPSVGEAAVPHPPAVALVPVVAWDEAGTRLGRGGGFYDRLLAGLPMAIARVGLAYEFQEVPELPRDPWDVPLHYVITERRVVCCGGAGGHVALQKGVAQQ